MLKNKPFLIAAIVFGTLGILVLILTAISFFEGDNLISGAIGSLLGLDKESFRDSTMAQIAVVFFIPTFIFAFRALADIDDAAEKAKKQLEESVSLSNAAVIPMETAAIQEVEPTQTDN